MPSWTTPIPSGIRQTTVNGTARVATAGEPADDDNKLIAAVTELRTFDLLLAQASAPDVYGAGTITTSPAGDRVGASVYRWADGATGVYTATLDSVGRISSYTVTHVKTGQTSTTYTQPAVTYADATAGAAVTTVPPITVA